MDPITIGIGILLGLIVADAIIDSLKSWFAQIRTSAARYALFWARRLGAGYLLEARAVRDFSARLAYAYQNDDVASIDIGLRESGVVSTLSTRGDSIGDLRLGVIYAVEV